MKSQQRLVLGEIQAQIREYHKNYDFSGYTGIKLRFYIESAAILTWLLQGTNPTLITLIYALLGVAGGVLLSLPNRTLVLLSLFIFFTKGILDSVDGHLARLSDRVSELGRKLDIYSGTIGTICFYLGLGFYLGHRVNYFLVPYVFILAVILRKWLNIEMGRSRVMDSIILIIFVVEILNF